MIYKLKENAINKNSQTPMFDYLKSLGIEKVSSFLNKPDREDELDPFLITNMMRCVDVLHKAFTDGKKFFLQVDSDTDGYTSSSIFYRYFTARYPNADIYWRLHDGKEHGVILDTVPKDRDVIVLPDSGSMQLEEQKALAEAGKIVVIIDHHNVSNVFTHPNVVLVNNQYSTDFPNKALSGAGMVLKVIQAHTEVLYDDELYKNFYDLAALGILADSMDSRTLDNNYIIYQGLHNIQNKMLKALIKQQTFVIPDGNNLNKKDITFSIAPLINGVIRAGSDEEKALLFQGFIEKPTQENFISKDINGARVEDYYSYVARTSYNTKNRQNNRKEKCLKILRNKIEEEHLLDNKLLVIIADNDMVPQNITGLVAMDLLKEYGVPSLVLRPKVEDNIVYYAGSGRGKMVENFNSFLKFLRGSKYIEYAEGHDFAFGTMVKADNLDAFIQESNERLQNVNFVDDFIEVDVEFNENDINYSMLYEFAKHKYLYGNSIPEPVILIHDNLMGADVRLMGKDQSSVRIDIGSLSCIKFKDKDLADKLHNINLAQCTICGTCDINEYNGYENIQLKIDNIDIAQAKKKMRLF